VEPSSTAWRRPLRRGDGLAAPQASPVSAFGATAGYLHSSFSSWEQRRGRHRGARPVSPAGPGRYRHRIDRFALSVGAGAGLVLAQARLAVFDSAIPGHSWAFAWDGSAEAALLLHRSQVVFGLRYLVMSLGKLSSGDTMVGDTGGFIVDAGYRIGWK